MKKVPYIYEWGLERGRVQRHFKAGCSISGAMPNSWLKLKGQLGSFNVKRISQVFTFLSQSLLNI